MAHEVFISYSSIDKEAAEAVCAALEENKIRCWIAPRDITPGKAFSEAIINGIQTSKVFVLVYSTNSNHSPQVIKEVDRAVHHGLSIINLRLDDEPLSKKLEYYISDVHWMDATSSPLEKHLDKLLRVVQILLKPEEVKDVEMAEALRKGIIKQNEPAGISKGSLIAKKRAILVSGLIMAVVIAAILIIAAILVYPKILKRDKLEYFKSKGEISVAVMPFQNMTKDTSKNLWEIMIQDNLITSLSNSEEVKVRQEESITTLLQKYNLTNYASITPSIASNVSQSLDANVFVHGSINQMNKTIRLNARLFDSETKDIYKSFQLEGAEEKILQLTDSLSGLIKNFLIMSVLEKNVVTDFRPLVTTKSLDAYRLYLNGIRVFYDNLDYSAAEEWFLKAIEIDTNFTEAMRMLAYSYRHQDMYEEAKEWCLRLYNKRDQMSVYQKLTVDVLHAILFETIYEQIKYLNLNIEYDALMPAHYYVLANQYSLLQNYTQAISLSEKELEIYDKWNSKPRWINSYTRLGNSYHKTEQYRKERKLYKKAEQDFPDNERLLYRQAVLALTKKETGEANRYIEKYITLLKIDATSEATIATNLANIYAEANIINKAGEYHRQALSLEPESPDRTSILAYFLVDNDLDIDEGLELIDKVLANDPENYNYLHTKGWGLYKQGNYQEAIQVLQKSWDIRREEAVYDHEAYLHLEEAKRLLPTNNIL